MRPLCLIVLTLSLLAGSSQAGDIHPGLAVKLSGMSDDETIQVIVHMSEQAPMANLDADLKRRGATRRERHREVILALQDAARSQAALREHLDQRLGAGVAGYTGHWISNLIVLSADKAVIEDIAAREDVRRIESDFVPVPVAGLFDPARASGDRGIGITPGLEAINAPAVWYALGYTGLTRIVASMDTGVDLMHPALMDRWRGNHAPWQECWLDVIDEDTVFPLDLNGHGTHTCGTMTGLAPDDSIGVAWGAEWIACNAIDMTVGEDFDNAVIQAFEWFADPDGDPETVADVPDVMQNSWGVGEHLGYPDCYTLWYEVIDNCEAAGVVCTWSAGNSGPDPETMGAPADRAASLTNCFSVGAVNATHHDWPYPIADFSSRGPSTCEDPAEFLVKPEVVAPGVAVYSSIPNGGYGESDGTSMAGPHVAGVVALMRQANPNLDVDEIKEILMATARDEGDPAGEDNTYGHGLVDAYAAVQAVIAGFGALSGSVTNASWMGVPLPGAHVQLVGDGYLYVADTNGDYSGRAAPALYTARASMPGFAPEDFSVLITEEGLTLQDFQLTDIAGPAIDQVSQPMTAVAGAGPVAIEARVIDHSEVESVELRYLPDQADWHTLAMTHQGGDIYRAEIPALPADVTVEYYVQARDMLGLESVNPAGAPAELYTLYFTELAYAYDGEDPADPGWLLGVFGDDASAGVWVREDPVGTEQSGVAIQPEDDHTAEPGIKCFVTENGDVGGPPHASDVDGGCTTLRSPIMDAGEANLAFLSYWRWYATVGITADDDFLVEVSNDGGANWQELERVSLNENSWRRTFVELSARLPLTDRMVVRFVACDENLPSLVEAAVDDFQLELFSGTVTGVPEWRAPGGAASILRQSSPNPYRPAAGEARIGFTLDEHREISLRVYDTSGRLVRTLARGEFAPGAHETAWNGRDERGHAVSSGVYFYRLSDGRESTARRLVLIR